MFDNVKRRWQTFLDGASEASPYHHLDAPVAALPAPRPVSAVNRRDPYAALAPDRLDREWEAGQRRSRPAVPPHQPRPYEVNASDWVRAQLREFDAVVARARRDMAEFVDRARNLPTQRRDWETPQYGRRHARNMASVRDDLTDLAGGGKPREIVKRMLERAERASSPEITGLIPVITPAMEEEAWS